MLTVLSITIESFLALSVLLLGKLLRLLKCLLKTRNLLPKHLVVGLLLFKLCLADLEVTVDSSNFTLFLVHNTLELFFQLLFSIFEFIFSI